MTIQKKSVLRVQNNGRQTLYSFEGFPFWKSSQSTLPALGFHSSPRVSSNSVKVSPGGNLLIMIFNLGVAALGNECGGTVAGLF